MADAERCVCCGEIIPEGQQVCQNCLLAVKQTNEELQFTRHFIHEHGLEFALAAAWERRNDGT